MERRILSEIIALYILSEEERLVLKLNSCFTLVRYKLDYSACEVVACINPIRVVHLSFVMKSTADK